MRCTGVNAPLSTDAALLPHWATTTDLAPGAEEGGAVVLSGLATARFEAAGAFEPAGVAADARDLADVFEPPGAGELAAFAVARFGAGEAGAFDPADFVARFAGAVVVVEPSDVTAARLDRDDAFEVSGLAANASELAGFGAARFAAAGLVVAAGLGAADLAVADLAVADLAVADLAVADAAAAGLAAP